MVFGGNSLRGTSAGGGITISMSNSGRYMVRGRRVASLFNPSNMYWDGREVRVESEVRWQGLAATRGRTAKMGEQRET